MRSVGMALAFLLGCALIGYGVLPLFASDMTLREHLIGYAMIACGIFCLVLVVTRARPRPN